MAITRIMEKRVCGVIYFAGNCAFKILINNLLGLKRNDFLEFGYWLLIIGYWLLVIGY
jgi:hypothetical protein